MQTRRAIVYATVPGMLVLLAAIVGGWQGYRLNLTPSMPLGIWRAGDTIHRGAYVTACITRDMPSVALAFDREYFPHGECASGYSPLLKEIGAVPGDTVTLNDDGVAVNGHAIPHTKTNHADTNGRPMQYISRGTYIVPPGEFWLFANGHPNSYDSRYFGPVKVTNILHSMRPILTIAYPTI